MGKKCVQRAHTTRTTMGISAVIPQTTQRPSLGLCTSQCIYTVSRLFIHITQPAFYLEIFTALYTVSTVPTITTKFFLYKTKPIIV